VPLVEDDLALRDVVARGLREAGLEVATAGDGTDGALTDTVIGTYLHWPVLARNPDLADLLLRRATGLTVSPLQVPGEDESRRLHVQPQGRPHHPLGKRLGQRGVPPSPPASSCRSEQGAAPQAGPAESRRSSAETSARRC
jgi:hypothetical protein